MPKSIFKIFLNKIVFQKLAAYLLLIIFFYSFRDFLGIFFLIFIFSYLFFAFGKFIKTKIDTLFDKICTNKKRINNLKRFFGLNIIILFMYFIFIFLLIFTISDLIPKIKSEFSGMTSQISQLSSVITDETNKLDQKYNLELTKGINDFFYSETDYKETIKSFIANLKIAGKILVQICIALILSYVFIIDRKKLYKYLEQIKKSNFSFFYYEYHTILEKITKSFGLILKAQAMIATANTILTVLGLYLIGLFFPQGFPYIPTLAVIVFIFGFIPVLGTFLSSAPILFIAFTATGSGLTAVIAAILVIIIVHTVEAYYLNPKIVSSFMGLPLSLTFIILIVSEHLFGFAGLLIGISSFYFIVDILKDTDKIITKTKNKYQTNKNLLNKVQKKLNKSKKA